MLSGLNFGYILIMDILGREMGQIIHTQIYNLIAFGILQRNAYQEGTIDVDAFYPGQSKLKLTTLQICIYNFYFGFNRFIMQFPPYPTMKNLIGK